MNSRRNVMYGTLVLSVLGLSCLAWRASADPAEKKVGEPAAKTPAKQASKKATDPEPADEAAIREAGRAYVKAYNAHDAKALAALFAVRAEFIDEDGDHIIGREAIEKSFVELFNERPNAQIAVEVRSIKMLTPNIAVEEGNVGVTREDGGDDAVSSYMAVNVKVDGKWLLGTVRNLDISSEFYTPHERLKKLEWLIGEWVEESDEAVIKSSVNWDDSGSYLIQKFEVQVDGKADMKGTMRIGWDPLTKQFKSWLFDSGGGHSEGLWIQSGDKWVVKSSGVNADGAVVSATGEYRPIDAETFGWQCQDRVVAGEEVEDIPEVVVKRVPPKAGL